jgi:hypothetical protein
MIVKNLPISAVKITLPAKEVETLPGHIRHPAKATGTAGRLLEGFAVSSITFGEKATIV